MLIIFNINTQSLRLGGHFAPVSANGRNAGGGVRMEARNVPSTGQPAKGGDMSEKSKESGGEVPQSVGAALSNPAPGNARTFRSTEIFAHAQEVIIEHEGDQYRLRHTSKGKLILTK